MKDYADGARHKTLTLDALEFIRRFLLHVLPKGFVRIRHYGLLAPSNIKTKLARARELLPSIEEPSELSVSLCGDSDLPWWEVLFLLTGEDVFACPRCPHGRLIRTELEARTRDPPRVPRNSRALACS